ncbi:MAG: FAD-binding oxidoreductase [Planctomycetota bacterium]|nr:FAD-binding oxidoreductase [Planctomycetota bacterium]
MKRSYEYVEGWGMATGDHARVLRPRSIDEVRACFEGAREQGTSLTLRGTGCSYGDASQPVGGHVLDLTRMNQMLGFDPATGVADLEGGVTIEQLWKHGLPLGYWPKVVSGTMYPTVAGAAAMNIHGKNNYKVGTFGDNTLEIDVLLPNGELRTCNREQNSDLFHAAIGGFGVLGCITRVKTKTTRVHSGELEVLGISCHDLEEMMTYIDAHTHEADYLVGWIDCFAGRDAAGRGLIHHARYLPEGVDPNPAHSLRVDQQELPTSILGFPKGEVWRILRLFNHDLGMRLVNAAKHQAGRLEGHKGWYRQSHAGFNFLLDYVPNWKYAYGRRPGHGLIQYQSFLPKETAHACFLELLARSKARGHTSYLGVFKRHRPDPFWMTHSVDGWSLALDFKVTPGSRASLWACCDELTRIVLDAGGKFYFAKDLVLGQRAMVEAFPEGRREQFLALKRETDPEGLLDTALFRRIFSTSGELTAPAL